MVKWEEIHWVRNSGDIPRNDFLNYTAEELVKRYPKIPIQDVIMQRHVFFPKKFPLPPEYRVQDAQYRRNLIVRSPADLRDSIFFELSAEDIRSRYPQFGFDEVRAEKALREVRQLQDRVRKNLRTPDPLNDRRVLADIDSALRKIDEVKPAGGELSDARAALQSIRDNVAKRVDEGNAGG